MCKARASCRSSDPATCRRRDDVVTEATEFPSGEPGTFR
jgi:hypothetical protein